MLKYNLKKQIAIQAAESGRRKADIINQLAAALGVDGRTIYNYTNIRHDSETIISEDRLKIICEQLGCSPVEMGLSAAVTTPA